MTDLLATGLIRSEEPIPSVNEEFNQYMDYYMQLIRIKSEGNVLVVEDDPMCKLFIEHSIRKFSPKIHLLTASSGEEALEILKTTACELLIADYFLEGSETGLELCREAHALYPKMKCLMISGMTFYQYKELALNSEIQPEFMEKPLSKASIDKYLTSFFEEINFK